MKKISDIYTKYKIMPSLQQHMVRVAAVASLICDNFSEPLPKEEIITACLFHDMGNIVKFKLDYFPEFNKPEGIEYWQKVQDEYIKKYGNDEHKATIQIMKEINLPDNIIFVADQVDFPLLCNISNSSDINAKIAFYADARVDPHGIVSYDERMNEGKKRYKNHKSTFGAVEEKERKKLVECGRKVEKQIFSKCKIKPEDINNETVAHIIEELKTFVVK